MGIKQYDLGADDGFVEIKIGETILKVCPAEQIEKINKLAETSGAAAGREFVDLIRRHIAGLTEDETATPDAPGTPIFVSSDMAMRFYHALQKAEKEHADFFETWLTSLTGTVSTPEASAAANELECSPISPG